MKKKRKWRWVTRDNTHQCVFIWSDLKRPDLNFGFWTGGDNVICCAAHFLRIFGFCPKVGECLKVEFSGKVVK